MSSEKNVLKTAKTQFPLEKNDLTKYSYFKNNNSSYSDMFSQTRINLLAVKKGLDTIIFLAV